jgi:hypothetical protein
MKTNKTIGGLFLAGAIALFIPYTALTIIFEYPDILRQDTATILTKFHQGGSTLIWTWFAFAITGIPLLPAYILLGQAVGKQELAGSSSNDYRRRRVGCPNGRVAPVDLCRTGVGRRFCQCF